MSIRRRSPTLFLGMLILSFLFGCGGTTPTSLGLNDGRLAPCPDRPNCVASDAEGEAHRIDPFRLAGDPAAAWSALQRAVADLPRTTIVETKETYLRAEAKSRLFGFVDDLEFQLRPDEGLIAIRSAARTGYSDLGVNAGRIDDLRSRLQAEGILR